MSGRRVRAFGPQKPRSGRTSGSVLISVLWVVLVLSLVAFSLAAAVRAEVDSSRTVFDSEKAFYMARGAADLVFNSWSKNLPFPEDSPIRRERDEYVIAFDSGEARVRFQAHGERININTASDLQLATIFNSLGVDRETRNSLVDSILDWRDPDDIPHLYGAEVIHYPQAQDAVRTLPANGPFTSIDELLLVKNMTPEIFYGSIGLDAVTQQYRRTPGLRDLIALGGSGVNPNIASYDVLAAIPGVTPSMAAGLIEQRTERPFADVNDIENRLSEFVQSESLEYLNMETGTPSELVSRATVAGSGVSRSVRLLFRTVQRVTFIGGDLSLYRIADVAVPDRWRYE